MGFFERSLADEPSGAIQAVAEWRDRISRLENRAKQKGWQTTGDAAPLPEWLGCANFKHCE
jgi:hypothetical protein